MFDAMGSTDAQRVKIVVFLLKGEAAVGGCNLKELIKLQGSRLLKRFLE